MAKSSGTVPWDVTDTKFFVNTEGCGYPPTVNCSAFAKEYAYANIGKIFPCYYSRTHPETVVARCVSQQARFYFDETIYI